jgi:hypothetical protein
MSVSGPWARVGGLFVLAAVACSVMAAVSIADAATSPSRPISGAGLPPPTPSCFRGFRPCPPGKRAPVGRYRGSDGAGAVGFKVEAVKRRGDHPPTVLVIRDFHFANKCAAAGTTLTKTILVRHQRFNARTASGITISGRVFRWFTASFFGTPPPGLGPGETGAAKGVARLHRGACDTGKLRFRATWAGRLRSS